MTRQIPYQIRNAYRDEWDDAMTLAWKTFMKFEADIYTDEGIQNFEDFITDTTLHRMFLMGVYQMFVALDRKQIVGMLTLRNNSHISLLFVDEKYQNRGYGTRLMAHWERDMKSQGYGMVLISTQVDETAQHFYRRLGYHDCGGFVIDVPGHEQPMELFMVKSIS